jgi:uncharacterized lipoprotein YmbA
MHRIAHVAALALLAGCGAPPERFAAPLAPAGERIAVTVRQLEVRQVSLPSYARDEEIWIETAEGALTADNGRLWADDPERGMTLELSRQLSAITGARVAAEPWPFDQIPQARLELRVDSFIAGADGRFRITGQYFVASTDRGRDRAASFAVSAPIAPESGPPGIAAARAQATRDLARLIARDGL